MAQARTSRAQRAYRYLTDEVLRGRWEAGEIVSTYALAEETRLSRTPIAAALKRLEAEGVVEILPQVGCRIVRPSAGALAELLAVRAGLEGVAAEAAARRVEETVLAELESTLRRLEKAVASEDMTAYSELNRRFHLAVVQAAGMPRLAETARSVWSSLRYQLARLPVPEGQLRESEAEHRELFEGLQRRSPTRARAAAERHVRLSEARLLPVLGNGKGSPFVHRALIYEDEADLLAATVPFLEEGLAAGERQLVVTTPRNAEVLGRSLGRKADAVEFRDSREWYVLPTHTLLAYQRYVEEADTARVRIVGELPFGDESRAPISDWIRYESTLNVAFGRLPVSIMCSYDARELPAPVLTDARRTHPELCAGAGSAASEEFTETMTLLRELDREELEEPTVATVELPITGDLRGVRDFVLERARDAGLSGKSLQDTFLAVQEVASNTLAHGAREGTLRTWIQDGELIFEVQDHMSGNGHPVMASLGTEPALLADPRGLWIARLLCDLVEVRSGAGGLVVRLHVALD